KNALARRRPPHGARWVHTATPPATSLACVAARDAGEIIVGLPCMGTVGTRARRGLRIERQQRFDAGVGVLGVVGGGVGAVAAVDDVGGVGTAEEAVVAARAAERIAGAVAVAEVVSRAAAEG